MELHHTQGTYPYLPNEGEMEDSVGYGYLVVPINIPVLKKYSLKH